MIDTESTPLKENRKVLGAAGLLTVANIIQRVLGMAREIVKANLFGATGVLSAFNLAALVPNTLFQLIAGGEMVTSSLVPVFSDYVAKEQRDELWTAFGTILSLVTLVLSAAVILVELFAPSVAQLIGANNFEDDSLFMLTVELLRVTAPVMLFLSISSIITAVLFALERFTLPAFTIATFNLAIIIVAIVWPETVYSLAWGMLLGSILMIVLQLPALRDGTFRPKFNFRHPVVRQVLRLYTPIVLGLIVNQASFVIGYNLATRTGDESVTYMAVSTTLYQFPLGLVVMGLSTATLPMLSQQANGQLEAFKATLAQGLRFVIVFIMPLAAGLFALALVVIQLLFEHGQFTPENSFVTSWVLRIDLLGLPFAAVDQMLVYAFYARKDTLRPALVGVASVVFYLIMAVSLIAPFGIYGLMIANATKLMLHAAIMIWLLHRHVGGFSGFGIMPLLFKSLFGGISTGLVAYLTLLALMQLPLAEGLAVELVRVVVPGLIGGLTYLGFAYFLKIEEVFAIWHLVRNKIGS